MIYCQRKSRLISILTIIVFFNTSGIYTQNVAEQLYQKMKNSPCIFTSNQSDASGKTLHLFGTFPKAVCDIIFRFLKVSQNTDPNKRLPFHNAIIFYGPPGTGKTTIAKIIAQKTGAKFHFHSGSGFINSFQGSGVASIQMMFNAIDKDLSNGNTVVLFIDEIDGSGKDRDESTHGEEQRALIELGKQIEKYRDNPKILIIGATNKQDQLDPMFRNRRFDMVEIPLPDENSCKEIFKNYLSLWSLPHHINEHIPQLAKKAYENKLNGDDINKIIENAYWDSIGANSDHFLLIAIQDHMNALISEKEKTEQESNKKEQDKALAREVSQEQLNSMKETEWHRWKCENWDIILIKICLEKMDRTADRYQASKGTWTDFYNYFGANLYYILQSSIGVVAKNPNIINLSRDELIHGIAEIKNEYLRSGKEKLDAPINNLRQKLQKPQKGQDEVIRRFLEAMIDNNEHLKQYIGC